MRRSVHGGTALQLLLLLGVLLRTCSIRALNLQCKRQACQQLSKPCMALT